MGHSRKAFCELCGQSKETKTTGALSTKEDVTAHQNCLLFSSGIYCRDSPLFDDLFGFSVDDVREEVRRGKQLMCNRCKKKGATVGCEVKRCKKSYHYPCAIEDGGKAIEEPDEGKYELYCPKHYQQRQGSFVNGHVPSTSNLQTSNNDSEAGPSKTNTKDDTTAAGPSGYSSDSNSSRRSSHSKRRLTFSGKQADPPSKRNRERWNEMVTDDSSDPGENEPNTDMAEFAPLESDLEGSAVSVPESQTAQPLIRNTQSPTGSHPGNQEKDESKNGISSDNESDAESESLLAPVRTSREPVQLSVTDTTHISSTQSTEHSAFLIEAAEVIDENGEEFSNILSEQTVEPSVPQQRSAAPAPSPENSKPCSVTSQATSLAPPSPHPDPSMNAEIFWRSCNSAGCTQAIFTDFINQMQDISSRILSGQASQDDYDVAVKVMESSGKLTELVTRQQKELEKKQMELQKAAAAMTEAVSALRK